MEIQCECGKFRAELQKFPEHTPGRLKCYCDDCQTFLHYLGRADLLDANGGTEIIPVYPSEVKILSGQEYLVCSRIHAHGMFRFSTSCCKTPIGNTEPKRPWLGLSRYAFTARNATELNQKFPEIRASIMGRYAKGEAPHGTPQKFNLKGMVAVVPFILKGVILGKAKPSPFFQENGSPVVNAHVLSEDERKDARLAAGV